jgi:proteasome lid subunit RPN8/RPN11
VFERVDLDPELESRFISSSILHEICLHALDAAPEECCGLVMGTGQQPLARVIRVTNVMTKMHVADPETFPRDARHAYYMAEIEYLRAIEEAEAREETVTAIYHSHFGQGCYLSQDDLAFAGHPLFPFPQAEQIVVSVLADGVSEVGVFEPDDRAPGGFKGRRLEAAP